jgi:hypothetical protein
MIVGKQDGNRVHGRLIIGVVPGFESTIVALVAPRGGCTITMEPRLEAGSTQTMLPTTVIRCLVQGR